MECALLVGVFQLDSIRTAELLHTENHEERIIGMSVFHDDILPGEIIRVLPSNFDVYRNNLRDLLWENMMRHYEAGKVDADYFETKTSEIRDYLEQQKAVIFVYIVSKRVRGCIWAYPKLFLNERRLFVQLLQVNADSRNLGIGRVLLHTIEEYAAKNEYDAVDMITSANNEGALRFYQREGYEFERIQLWKMLNKAEY